MDDAEYLAWRAEIDLCEDTIVLADIQIRLGKLAALTITPQYIEVLINRSHARMDVLRNGWLSYTDRDSYMR